VKRTNHLVTPSERWTGVDLGVLVAPALRVPLAVLACAIALAGVTGAAEQLRLRAAEDQGAVYERQLAAVELDAARIRAVERDVARLHALEASIAEIRRSGALQASEIAALGNRVPPGAWLTSLRADGAAIAIEGGGRGLDAVATTVSSLAHRAPYGDARLLSVHDDPVRSGVRYALMLEKRR
jgi:Tfp pilus assembly protein PilN